MMADRHNQTVSIYWPDKQGMLPELVSHVLTYHAKIVCTHQSILDATQSGCQGGREYLG